MAKTNSDRARSYLRGLRDATKMVNRFKKYYEDHVEVSRALEILANEIPNLARDPDDGSPTPTAERKGGE
jgi:hypothetical protein